MEYEIYNPVADEWYKGRFTDPNDPIKGFTITQSELYRRREDKH